MLTPAPRRFVWRQEHSKLALIKLEALRRYDGKPFDFDRHGVHTMRNSVYVDLRISFFLQEMEVNAFIGCFLKQNNYEELLISLIYLLNLIL